MATLHNRLATVYEPARISTQTKVMAYRRVARSEPSEVVSNAPLPSYNSTIAITHDSPCTASTRRTSPNAQREVASPLTTTRSSTPPLVSYVRTVSGHGFARGSDIAKSIVALHGACHSYETSNSEIQFSIVQARKSAIRPSALQTAVRSAPAPF